MAARPADFYEVLGVPRTRQPGGDPARLPQAGPHLPPRRQQGPRRRGAVQGDLRGVRRALRPGHPRGATTRFGPDFRQVPEGVDPQTWARARAGAGGGGAGAGAAARGRGGDRTSGGWSSSAWAEDIDLEDLFGGMFGGGGGRRRLGADPGRRPGGRAGADRRGGLPRRAPARSPCRPGRAARLRGRPSRPGSPTGSASAWPGRAARAATARAAGDLYLVVRLAPHPRYRVEGRDITVDLPLAPWEAALGASVAGRHARRRGEGEGAAGHVQRPAAAAARPRHAQPARRSPATCTPRCRIMVPRRLTDEERRLFEQLAARLDVRPAGGGDDATP